MTEKEVKAFTALMSIILGIFWGLIANQFGATTNVRLIVAVVTGGACYFLLRTLQLFGGDDDV